MKAVLSKTVGGPETLVIEDIAVPTPGKGQVLIEVKACGVNFPDSLMLLDMYQFKPARPFAPGGEVAGEATEAAVVQLLRQLLHLCPQAGAMLRITHVRHAPVRHRYIHTD